MMDDKRANCNEMYCYHQLSMKLWQRGTQCMQHKTVLVNQPFTQSGMTTTGSQNYSQKHTVIKAMQNDPTSHETQKYYKQLDLFNIFLKSHYENRKQPRH